MNVPDLSHARCNMPYSGLAIAHVPDHQGCLSHAMGMTVDGINKEGFVVQDLLDDVGASARGDGDSVSARP